MFLNNFLYGLAYDCPLHERADDCILHAIDELPYKEKVNFIRQLEISDKKKIFEYHKTCWESRELNDDNISTPEL